MYERTFVVTNPSFKLGAFTNPDKQVRQEAIDLTKKAIDGLREIDSNLLIIQNLQILVLNWLLCHRRSNSHFQILSFMIHFKLAS